MTELTRVRRYLLQGEMTVTVDGMIVGGMTVGGSNTVGGTIAAARSTTRVRGASSESNTLGLGSRAKVEPRW